MDVMRVTNRVLAIPVVLVGLGAAGALLGVAGPAAVVVLVPLAVIAVRLWQVRLTAETDELLVRNVWSTVRLRRIDIAACTVEDSIDFAARNERQRTVYASMYDGTSRRISATQRDYLSSGSSHPPGTFRNGADDICQELYTCLNVGA